MHTAAHVNAVAVSDQVFAAQAYLISLGILAATAARSDSFIRSGFQISYSGTPTWVFEEGGETEEFILCESSKPRLLREAAIAIYTDALKYLESVGVSMNLIPIVLVPSATIQDLVNKRPALGGSGKAKKERKQNGKKKNGDSAVATVVTGATETE